MLKYMARETQQASEMEKREAEGGSECGGGRVSENAGSSGARQRNTRSG